MQTVPSISLPEALNIAPCNLTKLTGKPKERSLLEWQKRLHIILGIAEGVKHLHEGEGSAGNVIHRDLKPANVLLDGGWSAKVADFGTAKLLLAGATGTRTRIGTP
jgi:serine/threonine protein kinase